MSDEVIELSDLPEGVAHFRAPATALNGEEQMTVPVGVPLADVEQRLILASLERNAGGIKRRPVRKNSASVSRRSITALGITIRGICTRVLYRKRDCEDGRQTRVCSIGIIAGLRRSASWASPAQWSALCGAPQFPGATILPVTESTAVQRAMLPQ